MLKRIALGVTVAGALLAVSFLAAGMAIQPAAPACACCEACVCDECLCEVSGCACDVGGDCFCSEFCCAACCTS